MGFLKNLFKSKSPRTGLVFIVEDNAAYAKMLQAYLKTNFSSIKEIQLFPVGETCLLNLHKNPDAIIVDYFLDTKYADAETGLEIVKRIRVEKPEMNIIVLSAQKEIGVVMDSVKKYNCSYVKKDETAFERVNEIMKDIFSIE